MRIRLVAVGPPAEGPLAEAQQVYLARLPRAWRVALEAVPAARASGRDRGRRLADEAARLETVLGTDVTMIALERTGREIDSEMLAARIDRWLAAGRDLVFVVGGADGLDPALTARADFSWSLSPLTFPHQLARLIVLEQIYRASTILAGHPYHAGH